MKHTFLLKTLFFLIGLASLPSWAESSRNDYDLDNDGLIEINDLKDLDAIRNDLHGLALYGYNTGCPNSGCKGFELTKNLDFDTNADGKMNASDAYWNDGEGWVPIGDYNNNNPFSAVFEGNGFVIRNLMINRPDDRDYNSSGLFASTQGAVIRRMGITGPLMSIVGNNCAGSFAGRAEDTLLEGVFATGKVDVRAPRGCGSGGFVGDGNSWFMLRNAFSSVVVKSVIGDSIVDIGSDQVFGPVLMFGKTKHYESTLFFQPNVYFAADVMDVTPAGNNVNLAQLRCPGAANDTQCAPGVTLYKNWDLEKDGDQKYWKFEAGKLPGLVLNGKLYRDSDADGILDADDKFPMNVAASVDADGDAVADVWNEDCDAQCREKSGLVLDQFLGDPAASDDADLDGMPDYWNPGCDQTCWSRSSLKLDAYPGDGDNDGLSDLKDTDDNNDGQVDADADSDGLIEIKNWAELDAIRYSLKGLGRQLSEKGALNATGCPSRVMDEERVKLCRGYELVNDLDFDTNADGKLDATDTYWNDGEGWLPIKNSNEGFGALFDGNGFVIRNLMINRPLDISNSSSGLFAFTYGAVIRRLGITGPLMSIIGDLHVGSFVGDARNTLLEGVFATGRVEATYARGDAGGLIGMSDEKVNIRNAFSSVIVKGRLSNPIIGYHASNNSLGPILSVGKLEDAYLSGYEFGSNVYWAADVMGGLIRAENAFTLAQLRCPGAANDTQCVPGVTLYKNWDLEKDGDQKYWKFEAGKLPGLVLNGKVYRDETVKAAISSSSSRSSSLSSSSINSSKSSSSKSSSSKSSAVSSSGNTQKGGGLGWGFMVVIMLLGCRRRFK